MKTLLSTAKRLQAAFSQMYAEALKEDVKPERLHLVANTLKGVDNVIGDADRVMAWADRTMTFKEFFSSQFAVEMTWCRLTVTELHPVERTVGVVLKWNPSNYKWLMPDQFEGFEEVGHLQSVGPIPQYGGLKGRIEALQLIVPEILMKG